MSSACGASTFVNYAKNLEQLVLQDSNLAGESKKFIKEVILGGTTVQDRNNYARQSLQSNVKAYGINPALSEKDQVLALGRLMPCDWINQTLNSPKNYLNRYTTDEFMRVAKVIRDQSIQDTVDEHNRNIQSLNQYRTTNVMNPELANIIHKTEGYIVGQDSEQLQKILRDYLLQSGFPRPEPISIPSGLIDRVIHRLTELKDKYPRDILDFLNGTNLEIYQYPRTTKEFMVLRGVTGSLQTPPQIGDIEVTNFPKSGTFEAIPTRDYINPYLKKIRIPAGSILAYHPSEDQVIFPTGSMFRVEVAPSQYDDDKYEYTSVYLGAPSSPILYTSPSEIPPQSILIKASDVQSPIDPRRILLGESASSGFLENIQKNNIRDYQVIEIGRDGNSLVQYTQIDNNETKQDIVLILNNQVYPASVFDSNPITYRNNSDITEILNKTVSYVVIENYPDGTSLFRFITQSAPGQHKTYLVAGKLSGNQIMPV